MVAKKTASKTTKTRSKSTRTAKKSTQPTHWFEAKRYGWGWGKATTWQGWLVYLGFLGLVVWFFVWANDRILQGKTFGLSETAFMATGLALTFAVGVPVLAAICTLKGEAPRWRWGDKK